MKYITPLLIKFVMITTVLFFVLSIYGASIAEILLTSVLLTGVSFIGDVYVLPKVGNVVASIADFGLAFAMIWVIGLLLFDSPNQLAVASFIAAIVIMFAEMAFHKYMNELVFSRREMKTFDNEVGRAFKMQTEFGSEPDFTRPDARENSDETKEE